MCSSSSLPGNPQVGNIHICQRDLSRDICQRWSQFAEGIANILHFDFHGSGQGRGVPDLNPNPWRSRFFWDSLSNSNFTRMNLDWSQDSCHVIYSITAHDQSDKWCLDKVSIGDKTTSDQGQKNYSIEVQPARRDRGAQSIHQRSACPHLARPGSTDTSAAATNRETDCIWLLPLHVLPHCTRSQ